MKTLLFLNGPEGWQTGIEDGFTYLQSISEISELKWFYFEEYSKNINCISEGCTTIPQMLAYFKQYWSQRLLLCQELYFFR